MIVGPQRGHLGLKKHGTQRVSLVNAIPILRAEQDQTLGCLTVSPDSRPEALPSRHGELKLAFAHGWSSREPLKLTNRKLESIEL